MKHTLTVSVLAATAGLLACGSGQSGTNQDFLQAAPTLERLAIAQNDSDVSSGALVETSDDDSFPTLATRDCHPHLFVRTNEIVRRVNRHFAKILHHVDELIEDNPLTNGQSKTWENVRAGLDRKFTMTRTDNSDGSVTYTFELDVAAVAAAGTTPSFVKVMSGSITHIGPISSDDGDGGTASVDAGTASTLVENKGTVTFDFTALASVQTRERARGQITDAFDNVDDPVNGIKRSATITLTNFVPEEGDPHGPRTGSYSWLREPGVGGKFVFQDTVVLFCLANPAGVQSDLNTVARWYKAPDGSVHGRSDSKATGGQLATGQAWMGVTCAQGRTDTTPAEGFWMMKLEDSTGATVSAHLAQSGETPCDPVFGAVPSATDNKTDYDFTATVTFPNEW
jgi:hypothetical protein